MCILLHNNRVGISGNRIYFLNTSTKFPEPYYSNHVIPRLDIGKNICAAMRDRLHGKWPFTWLTSDVFCSV